MSQKIQDILKRINFIEVDLEIQKQILFSIPSDQTSEMERVMAVIAEKKKMVIQLREEIKKEDPAEFEKLMKFERASEEFKKIAAEKKFSEIYTLNGNESCSISLKNGTTIDCLVKAKDSNDDWTVMTPDAEIISIKSEDTI